jgi:hypothetical protein
MFYVLEVQRLYTVDDMKAYNRVFLNTGWKEPNSYGLRPPESLHSFPLPGRRHSALLPKQEPKDKDDTVGYLKKIGYMNKKFTTKQEACLYYDNHNPHMRSLNALDTWTSALDPTTRLRYIVHNYYWEFVFAANFALDIKPFSNEKFDRNGEKRIDLGDGDWIDYYNNKRIASEDATDKPV